MSDCVPLARARTPGTVYLGVELWNLSRRADVVDVGYPPEDFHTRSPAARHIGWTADEDQISIVDSLTRDPARLKRVACELDARASALHSHGETHYRWGRQHAYLFHTNDTWIPPRRIHAARDPENHNWWRGLITCYPPFAYQVPKLTPTPRYFESLDPSADIPVTWDLPWEQEEIEAHNQREWAGNTMVSGEVSLGRSSRIAFWRPGVLLDALDGILVRWAVASPSSFHPLDGRTLWGMVINVREQRMSFFAIGAGTIANPVVDPLHPGAAGFALGTMFRTYSLLVQYSLGDAAPSLLNRMTRRELPLLLEKDRILNRNRKLGLGLDQLASGGSLMRMLLGGDVIDTPQGIGDASQGQGATVVELTGPGESTT